jgi:hypothetical protein
MRWEICDRHVAQRPANVSFDEPRLGVKRGGRRGAR